MPAYHFHLADGTFERDPDGVELSDVEAAKIEAVKYTAELLSDDPARLWADGQLKIEVTDERGMLVHAIIISVIEAPSPDQTGQPAQPAGSHQ